jgi:hypothetical protein
MDGDANHAVYDLTIPKAHIRMEMDNASDPPVLYVVGDSRNERNESAKNAFLEVQGVQPHRVPNSVHSSARGTEAVHGVQFD